ncbi:MAG: hypothetical protein R6U11_08135 [Bacteroidales bacterium]
MKKISRKGQNGLSLEAIPSLLITLVFIALTAVIVLDLNSSVIADYNQSGRTNASDPSSYVETYSNNDTAHALTNITEGITNITERAGLLGTIIILGVIITVVVGALGFAMR